MFEGYANEILCNYKFEFSIHAGPGDVMSVEFTKVTNSGATFTVGTSFYKAVHGTKFDNPEGQKITIAYPQILFVTFYNTGNIGDIQVTYSYTDQEPADAADLVKEIYQVEPIVEVTIKSTKANLTLVYILSGAIGLAIIIIICIAFKHCLSEKETNS